MILSLAGIANGREVTDLNRDWHFVGADGREHSVNVPHDFQIEQPWVEPSPDEKPDNSDGAANVRSRLSARGFKEMGTGTYTKTVFIPDSLKGKRLLLDFEGLMLYGDVYLNGERIGGTDYGYLGFECDAAPAAKYGQDNEIKVIASTGEPLNSRWYTGGGLFRNVKMVATDPDLYFNRHPLLITTPEITAEQGKVAITANINAKAPLEGFDAKVAITGPDGSVVEKTFPVKFQPKWRDREYVLDTITVDNPQLWDLDTPNLYTATVTLLRPDGSEADSYTSTFGFRTIEFSPEFGMKLNGKKVLLKGIANHHTLGALGAAAYPRAIEKRIEMLKEFGFNHIRTSHNPYSEDFLNLCDKHGILVVDELYDKWLTQYAGYRNDWTNLWQHNIPEWITRDRNHPSVVVWSLGNELQGYSNLPFNDWGVTAYKLQKTLLDKYDTSRPVTVAMHPRVRDLETDSLPAPLVHETDIAAYNYRYMYFPGDGRRFPNFIFYQSEANMGFMGPNFFVPENDKVLGLAYWGMIDYLGESLGWPAKGWTDGVFDVSLNPKPNAWFLKSMFTDEPVVHIGVVTQGSRFTDWNGIPIGAEVVGDSWNLNAGDQVKVYTYTNADEVALLLNGKEIGRKANDVADPAKRNRIVWDKVPYAPGTLKAVAYKNGKEVGRHQIETAGKAVKLVAKIDNPEWKADGQDLQHVYVEAVDSKGRRVPVANDTLKFTVDGDASIVAVSNGDMASNELNVTDTRSLHQGRALAIVRAGVTPGLVKMTVTADGYKPVTISFPTK